METDGRGHKLEAGSTARVDGCVGDGCDISLSPVVDLRLFRVEQALRGVEKELVLLDEEPAIDVQVSALERIRDNLAVVVRLGGDDSR
jgi:hypothetical protein